MVQAKVTYIFVPFVWEREGITKFKLCWKNFPIFEKVERVDNIGLVTNDWISTLYTNEISIKSDIYTIPNSNFCINIYNPYCGNNFPHLQAKST